jgi:hypothetical protein
MTFETLYRVDARDKSFADPSECEYYQPRIDPEKREGKDVFFVRETHGYFDDTLKQLKNMTETFNPNEPFKTWDEALGWYQKQIEYRASLGFVHAFVFDPMSPNAVRYRLLR